MLGFLVEFPFLVLLLGVLGSVGLLHVAVLSPMSRSATFIALAWLLPLEVLLWMMLLNGVLIHGDYSISSILPKPLSILRSPHVRIPGM